MTVPTEQMDAAALLTRLSGKPAVETPISAVFVGRFTAWKMKKAVRMPFADFTGLEQRHRMLLRELELNQPSAPALYRDVAAIVRTKHETLAITPEPEGRPVVEWVLRMAPVPAECFLDQPEAIAQLTPPRLDALGDMVAAMHVRLPPVEQWDHYAALVGLIDSTRDYAREAGLDEQRIAAWHDAIHALAERKRGWLAARAQAGFVRRCHGDLHLGNVLLWQGAPLPFDALEFDDALATLDVGYDLAFLLMDLELKAGRKAANRVLNRYVARTGDAGITGGLPLFMSLRAMIRAHVLQRGGRAEAAEYLAAALRHLEVRADPVPVIAIGGLPGSGKSTLARRLAPSLGPSPGAIVLRSDEIRKRQHGVSPEQHLPDSAYDEAADRAMAEELLAAVQRTVRGGYAAIADTTFLDTELRVRVEAAAREAGARFLGIWLHAGMRVLEARVNGRRGDASDATLDVLHKAASADPGPVTWRLVDASDLDREAQEIEAALSDLLKG